MQWTNEKKRKKSEPGTSARRHPVIPWVILVVWRQGDLSRAGGAFQDVGSDRDGRSAAAVLSPQASCTGLLQCGSRRAVRVWCTTGQLRVASAPWHSQSGRVQGSAGGEWRRESLQNHCGLVTHVR